MEAMTPQETYISVDVETSGPIPGEFSLLTIGACVVGRPESNFTSQLKPLNENADPEALKVTGLSMSDLARDGVAPVESMQAFKNWVDAVTGDTTPVFVGFNAAFDWSFVNYYFHRFLKENPFGFAALDIKSLFMGRTNCSWRDTRSSKMSEILQPSQRGTHDALDDAKAQAELFELALKVPVVRNFKP